jgi:hypothetical protein
MGILGLIILAFALYWQNRKLKLILIGHEAIFYRLDQVALQIRKLNEHKQFQENQRKENDTTRI